jgi:hypothetical protein
LDHVILEQWVVQRSPGSLLYVVSTTDRHESIPALLYHRGNAGKIEVDQPGLTDEFHDSLNSLSKNFIGNTESNLKLQILGRDFEKLVIVNQDQSVDLFAERLDARLSSSGSMGPFERKRGGDHCHRQGADFSGNAGSYRSRSGACATTHSSGDKNEVSAGQRIPESCFTLLGGLTTDLCFAPGPEATGHAWTQLDFDLGFGDG